MLVTEEEIEILAFRLYKEKNSYEKMIWHLAELCKTIQININSNTEDEWCDLNAFKTIGEIKAQMKYKTIIDPTKDQIEPIAKKLYNYKPEISKLNWFIAEKMILLKKIKNGYQ